MEKAKILIVEDEAIIAVEIEKQVQSLGHEVTSIADTGEKAIKKAEEDKPDLILMDIRIKGEMDGIDAAEIIRNRFGIPIIFSTAYLDQERIDRAKITMPFGYLLKPIQEKDMKVTLKMALNVARSDDERKRMENLLRIQRNLGISLGKSIDLQEMLRLCLMAALEASKMDCGGIYIIDTNQAFNLACHIGLSEAFVASVSHFKADSPQSQLVRGKKPIYANHDQLGISLTQHEQNEKLKSMALIPVEHSKQVIACLNVASFLFEEIPLFVRNTLETIVTQIGDAIVKKQSEEEITLQASLLEQVHNAIITVDFNNTILYWNKFAEELYQWTSQEAIGKNIIELLAFEEMEDVTVLNIKKLNQEGHWEGDYDVKRKDGTAIPVHITNVYLKGASGENIGYIGISIDISDRIKSETELQHTLEELKQLKNRLADEKSYLQDEINLNHNFGMIVGRNKNFLDVLKLSQQVSASNTNVLILGETGTGKELVARIIHNLSERKNSPLVKINCAALPTDLINSELFGHEKGAFTGALSRNIGRFELANGGTIFLDEMGDMPLETQAKILRVLQEGEFERLGSSETLKVDVRVLAATNRNLVKLCEEGLFRPDLYYRLNVFPIECPPLREKLDDIPFLVRHLVEKFNKKLSKNINTIPKNVVKDLQGYHWPGNVRELENVIERAMILGQNETLYLGNWNLKKKESSLITDTPSMDEMQTKHIIEVLKLTNGKISGKFGAAKILDLKATTLQSRMKKLGIHVNKYRKTDEIT